MSSKINAVSKSIPTKSRKDSAENSSKQMQQSTNKKQSSTVSSNRALVLNTSSTTVEVTVKAKGRKRTSTMVSGSPTSQKMIEEKKRPSSSGDSLHNWSQILREQNRPAMKQGIQQFAVRSQSSKSARHSASEFKETRRNVDIQKPLKYELNPTGKHFNEVPVKPVPSQKKPEEQLKVASNSTIPSSTSFNRNMKSVTYVHDRAVQCGGIFDYSNDRFSVFDPVRTLTFLMKELEGLVNDEKSSKILSDMEQALFRIPTEPGKLTSADMEAIVLRTKLEASTTNLEATTKKMEAMCETLREERDFLQQQVQKQATLLKEARQREMDLQSTVRSLKIELNDAARMATINQKTITDLKEDNKRIEQLQKTTAVNLNDQIELAQQRFMDEQYLKLEKDKLLVLLSYKDTQVAEYRTAMNYYRELQKLITEQLMNLREAYKHGDDFSTHRQISMIHGGVACSSPTSSDHSNVLISWRDFSDISLSTVERDPTRISSKKSPSTKGKLISFVEGMSDDLERKTSKDVNAQLEFVSLPGGETSHAISLPIYKEEECKRLDHLEIKSENQLIDDRKDSHSHDTVTAITEMERSFNEKADIRVEKNDKKNSQTNLYKPQMFGDNQKHRFIKEESSNKTILPENNSNAVKNHLPGSSLNTNIKKFQDIFKHSRQESKFPVHVPSPPRHYPNPDWSDSSLPSVSAISEPNVLTCD